MDLRGLAVAAASASPRHCVRQNRARLFCIGGIHCVQGSPNGANQRETAMSARLVTRRHALRMTMAAAGLAAPAVRRAAAEAVTPKGRMVLAWHSNFAARWL